MIDRRLSVAPMMDRTDRHGRFFLRQLSRRVLLYTEMVPAAALVHGDAERWLAFDASERPLALQVGGGDPGPLAACARLAHARGFDEINLNVGCPSERVRRGCFGAALMAEPERVAACVAAMRAAAPLPVTVKTRIGIDDHDDYGFLAGFVATVAAAGCATFIVHARKAVLGGLSPRRNREVPPLRYDRVWRLKRDFPALEIVVNGGVRTLEAVHEHLRHVDGVMIGRAAYDDPYLLADADRAIFGAPAHAPDRHQVVDRMLPYIAREQGGAVPLHAITRHMLGLFRGGRGGRAWRRYLSEHAHRAGADGEVVRAAARLAAADRA